MRKENASSAPEKMLWWEKTVEYAFVRQILPQDYLAAPLAGDAEKFFGDLMSENNEGLARLIEFKREMANIQTEVVKYYPKDEVPEGQTFEGAWLEAMNNEPCAGSLGHWFVYGEQQRETGELKLVGCQYGPEEAKAFWIDKDAQLGYVKPKQLLEYMERLLNMRTRGGGWSGSMVVATLNGKSMVMKPAEFIKRTMNLAPTPKVMPSGPKFEPPRMG